MNGRQISREKTHLPVHMSWRPNCCGGLIIHSLSDISMSKMFRILYWTLKNRWSELTQVIKSCIELLSQNSEIFLFVIYIFYDRNFVGARFKEKISLFKWIEWKFILTTFFISVVSFRMWQLFSITFHALHFGGNTS